MENFLLEAFKNTSNGDPLSKKIYDVLYETILERQFKPGDILIESKIANILDVSRTPCREAINKLETEGFVERIPNKGAVVTGISKEDIKEITLMISVLQGLAARCTAKKADQSFLEKLKVNIDETKFHYQNKTFPVKYLTEKNKKFHDLILEKCQKTRLISIVNNLYNQIKRARGTSMSIPDRRKKAIKQHEKIYNAIKSNDSKKAEKIMKKHLVEWGKVLIELESDKI